MVRMASCCELVRLYCTTFQIHVDAQDFAGLNSEGSSNFRKARVSFSCLASKNFAIFAFLVPTAAFIVLPSVWFTEAHYLMRFCEALSMEVFSSNTLLRTMIKKFQQ